MKPQIDRTEWLLFVLCALIIIALWVMGDPVSGQVPVPLPMAYPDWRLALVMAP